MPLANSFLRSEREFATEQRFPLDVVFCRSCTMLQTPDVIDPEVLFRDYIYVSGTSDTIAQHWVDYSRSVVELLGMESDDLVVEVASNDGTLLRAFQRHGVRTLGVEPATNIAEKANAAGVETVNEFFGSDVARRLRRERGPARAVVANNVFAHVDHTLDFLSGCAALVAADGLVVFEVPYVGALLDRVEYDTIYHEHLCYFSIATLVRACEAAGLSMVRVDAVPVHGGSLRMHAGHPSRWGGHGESVLAAIEGERRRGLADLETYRGFEAAVKRNREELRALLRRLRDEGRTVAGYGAPAKGNTLLNYCGIDAQLLAFTVDKNPMKVGLYTPGMHVPVLPVEALLERQPDYVLILAWNFADEILRQQAAYRSRGGRFITPVPLPEILA